MLVKYVVPPPQSGGGVIVQGKVVTFPFEVVVTVTVAVAVPHIDEGDVELV